MFGAMNVRNSSHSRVPRGRSPASFDAGFRRSVREFLDLDIVEREGIGPSRLGRIAVGNPGFVRACLVHGCDVRLDTADRVRILIGEAPFRARFRRELDLFMALTGTKPWLIGWRSVRSASFVQRLHRGASPNLSTVDRVRGWMHAQLRGAERRAVFAAAATEPPPGTAPSACPERTACPEQTVRTAPPVKGCMQPH